MLSLLSPDGDASDSCSSGCAGTIFLEAMVLMNMYFTVCVVAQKKGYNYTKTIEIDRWKPTSRSSSSYGISNAT